MPWHNWWEGNQQKEFETVYENRKFYIVLTFSLSNLIDAIKPGAINYDLVKHSGSEEVYFNSLHMV